MRTALAMDATGLNALEDSQEQELGDARVENATGTLRRKQGIKTHGCCRQGWENLRIRYETLRDRTYTLEEQRCLARLYFSGPQSAERNIYARRESASRKHASVIL